MAKRIAISKLNATTIDILNTIRANASYEYQSQVPEIKDVDNIPMVGEILYGYPALANQFISALMNRIALVRTKSAVFNNAYADLKKGYLEFGETVEEVFVNICKAREFSAEKAEARELKRSLPDVRTAFHSINYRAQYPITIQDEDLRMAFTSVGGVQDLIAKIVSGVYTAAEYDEYLLFKYLIIKAVAHGKMYPVALDTSDIKNSAVAFRGTSNKLTFMNTAYNVSGVHTTTPKNDQYIFMDADFNAKYDVNVLASAFNMDKAEFTGHLKLIDDFTTFDNDRFNSMIDGKFMEAVTAEELNLMKGVKAVLADAEWFQVYDNQNKMTENYVSSGEYWNYFYNVWKTVSSSPFSNAVVFVEDTANVNLPEAFELTVTDVSMADDTTIVSLGENGATELAPSGQFVQNLEAVKAGIAVHRYGAFIFPKSATDVTVEYVTIDPKSGSKVVYNSVTGESNPYTKAKLTKTVQVGSKLKLAKSTAITG